METLTKTIEHTAFESIACQEVKPFLDKYGGHLKFESVGKRDYQITLKISEVELQERIIVNNMSTDIANKYFLYRIHGAIALLLGGIHSP
jgi:hypothetical protein